MISQAGICGPLYKKRRSRIFLTLTVVLSIGGTLMAGCSPGYVVRAAYEQSKILIARREIAEVIADPESTPVERDKLQLVLDARSFAISMGLATGNSFTRYVKLDKDFLAWVLVAARKDSFALRTWWFPVVGRIPYKGFFEMQDATDAARDLESEGYEAWIRGTEAFSTLGWFNDPVMSTTLRNSHARIVNTVVHESVHATVWIKNNVPFNESLANFVGSEAAVNYYQNLLEACKEIDCSAARAEVAAAEAERNFQFELGALIDNLYAALTAVYSNTESTSEQKIAKRSEVFESFLVPFRGKYPRLQILKAINNAEIIQLKLYLSNLMLFRRLFDHLGGTREAFIVEAREIAKAVEKDPAADPFELVKKKIEEEK